MNIVGIYINIRRVNCMLEKCRMHAKTGRKADYSTKMCSVVDISHC
jgi:hypothetical protein